MGVETQKWWASIVSEDAELRKDRVSPAVVYSVGFQPLGQQTASRRFGCSLSRWSRLGPKPTQLVSGFARVPH